MSVSEQGGERKGMPELRWRERWRVTASRTAIAVGQKRGSSEGKEEREGEGGGKWAKAHQLSPKGARRKGWVTSETANYCIGISGTE